ncbi:BrnT family toxin [Chitinimonas sp. PSY-7]|uniref:BrnT family toxin n=1 Tax=Chitinimonas sp. PSY-7 TaxID=3459088 RepID=UPI00403FC9D8
MQLLFEWDPAKAASNLKKHGLDFETATLVFNDPLALTLFDEAHSTHEERWITLGQVEGRKLVVAVHTWRENEETVHVRIISARHATRHEERQYQGEP